MQNQPVNQPFTGAAAWPAPGQQTRQAPPPQGAPWGAEQVNLGGNQPGVQTMPPPQPAPDKPTVYPSGLQFLQNAARGAFQASIPAGAGLLPVPLFVQYVDGQISAMIRVGDQVQNVPAQISQYDQKVYIQVDQNSGALAVFDPRSGEYGVASPFTQGGREKVETIAPDGTRTMIFNDHVEGQNRVYTKVTESPQGNIRAAEVTERGGGMVNKYGGAFMSGGAEKPLEAQRQPDGSIALKGGGMWDNIKAGKGLFGYWRDGKQQMAALQPLSAMGVGALFPTVVAALAGGVQAAPSNPPPPPQPNGAPAPPPPPPVPPHQAPQGQPQPGPAPSLQEQMDRAVKAQDWALVAHLAAQMQGGGQTAPPPVAPPPPQPPPQPVAQPTPQPPPQPVAQPSPQPVAQPTPQPAGPTPQALRLKDQVSTLQADFEKTSPEFQALAHQKAELYTKAGAQMPFSIVYGVADAAINQIAAMQAEFEKSPIQNMEVQGAAGVELNAALQQAGPDASKWDLMPGIVLNHVNRVLAKEPGDKELQAYKVKLEEYMKLEGLYEAAATILVENGGEPPMPIPQVPPEIAEKRKDVIGRFAQIEGGYTLAHTARVKEFAGITAQVMGLNQEQTAAVVLGADVMDVGKLDVPTAVLDKVGRYTDEEMAEMKKHVDPERMKGYFELFNTPPAAREAAQHHHERFDGKGYPAGLAGEAIPLSSRILAVCDAFDSMTQKRWNQAERADAPKALTAAEALGMLKKNAGTQFDPKVVETFGEILERTGALKPVAEQVKDAVVILTRVANDPSDPAAQGQARAELDRLKQQHPTEFAAAQAALAATPPPAAAAPPA